VSPADAPPGRGSGRRPAPGDGGRRLPSLPEVERGDLRSRPPRSGTERTAPVRHGPVARDTGRPRPSSGRHDPYTRHGRTAPVRRPPGRLRRFVARWGWRAYAIPLLTVATVLTVGDLAVTWGRTAESASSGAAVSATPSAAAPTTAEAPPATTAPAPSAPAEGDADPTETAEAPAGSVGFVQQGAGTVTVVPGTSAVYGTGPLQRFVVEVEDGIGVDGSAFAAAVEATLGDPRSWGNGGRMSFQRVGADEAAARAYDFKVTLISPGNMEAYCPGVGTGGYTSCRYGDRAVINLARWETAVPDYEGDVPTYRQYVVNHEVGHALGNGHQPCPGPGQPAPVMQQQTLGLDGCARNAWPYP
jgi:hypothetical protein